MLAKYYFTVTNALLKKDLKLKDKFNNAKLTRTFLYKRQTIKATLKKSSALKSL